MDADDIARIVAEARVKGRAIGLLYRDAKGRTRARYLAASEVTDEHLRGMCPHRHAPRTFRLDRVLAIRLGPRIDGIGPDVGEPVEV